MVVCRNRKLAMLSKTTFEWYEGFKTMQQIIFFPFKSIEALCLQQQPWLCQNLFFAGLSCWAVLEPALIPYIVPCLFGHTGRHGFDESRMQRISSDHLHRKMLVVLLLDLKMQIFERSAAINGDLN